MCQILSLLDLFSGYDQIPLDIESRDLTTFATPIGLFRMCTLPQGATNSVGQFMRCIVRILDTLTPSICRPFLDDICVKGPTTKYDLELIRPGLRRYVVEHLQNLDKVLVNVELAACTIAAKKSQWCRPRATILGYLCGTSGRSPDYDKVKKVLEWKNCSDKTEVRSFYHLVGYYRQWIEHFAWISEPLTRLLRKKADFV